MKTQQLISILKFIFWIVFIFFLVEAGALLFNFGRGFINPESAKNIYRGLDLSVLRTRNLDAFLSVGSLSITVAIFKAYITYLVIKVATKGNLEHPFTQEIAMLISKISQAVLVCGIISLIADQYCRRLTKKGFFGDLTLDGQRGIVEAIDINLTWSGQEFLFLAAIIFIIAKVFQKGIELQTENDLTI